MAESKAPSKVTSMERAGTGLTVAGLVVGLVVVATMLFGHAITINSNDQAKSTMTILVIITLVGGVLALVATVLNVPGLIRQMGRARLTSTILSAVTLVALVVYGFAVLLPHVNNLNHLNDVIEPFGVSIQNDCQTPLNNETSRYKQIGADASAFPTLPNLNTVQSNLATLATAMTKDSSLVQGDLTVIQANLTKVQALSLPDGKYGDLRDGCVRDIQSTLGFLTSTSTIPTSQVVSGLLSAVSALPASIVPAAAQPIVAATIQATIPSSYSATGLITATNSLATAQLPLVFPASVPAATQQQLAPVLYVFLTVGYTQLLAGAMQQAANGTDAATTNAGNCFANDIIKDLNDNLTPFNVNTDEIVGQGVMPCTR